MTDHGDLPLPDYDHLPTGSLESRIKPLSREDVQQLLDYERAHGDRLPVVQVLEARLDQLAAGAEPTGGSTDAVTPETAPPPSGGSKVTPDTVGPPTNPPSQGVPTNPSQPRH